MHMQHYHAFLNYLAAADVAALIMDNQGRVLAHNPLSQAVRLHKGQRHWQDHCLNSQGPRPHSGQTVVYWHPKYKATAARLVTTKLQDSGLVLALFLNAEDISSIQQQLGFVLYYPQDNACYWSDYAASLHEESAPYYSKLSMQHFLQWYVPHQRDRLLYAMLECERAHKAQQVTLRIAHSGRWVRYLWLTLPINGKPLTCAFIRQVTSPRVKALIRPRLQVVQG